MLRSLGWRYAMRSLLVAAGVALVIGLPTDVIPNPFWTRMTPVRPEDYVFLIAISLVTGALLATYFGETGLAGRGAKAGLGGGALGYFAIGCPICNKLIVALLGTSGALTYFAPIQPILGTAAVALALAGLAVRLRTLASCRLELPAGADG